MNYRYTYNKYSLFNQDTIPLVSIKKNSHNIISPQIIIEDGNLNVTKKIDGEKYIYPKSVEQYYSQKYSKLPIYPLENHNNTLEKWEKKQPIQYNKINKNDDHFPINNLDSYQIIPSYDNRNIYSHNFFNQNDGRLTNYN
jgi:hypothetical protein